MLFVKISFSLLCSTFLLVCAILLLAGCYNPNPGSRETGKEALLRLIKEIEPWGVTTNYSQAHWERLIATARIAQRANPSTMKAALALFENQNKQNFKGLYEEDSKPYILIRMMYELPQFAPIDERFAFKGWNPRRININPDGTINLSWPIVWLNNSPHFVAPCRGSSGPPYKPEYEYEYVRALYPQRNLDKVSLAP